MGQLWGSCVLPKPFLRQLGSRTTGLMTLTCTTSGGTFHVSVELLTGDVSPAAGGLAQHTVLLAQILCTLDVLSLFTNSSLCYCCLGH